jgi:hypothetical protein
MKRPTERSTSRSRPKPFDVCLAGSQEASLLSRLNPIVTHQPQIFVFQVVTVVHEQS